MTKSVDFLQQLPVELHEEVLSFLHRDDWYALKSVSRQWYCLCQRRIWRMVAIATPAELTLNLREVMFDYFSPVQLGDNLREYQLVNYQQLEKLRSNQQFRKTVRENTVDLAVFYASPSKDYSYCVKSDKHTYEAISELFKHVRKVRVWCEPSPRDERFLSFQNMLDELKSTAEFSLALDLFNHQKNTSLDIDGMIIKNLHIRNDYDCTEAELQLPLWKSQDRIPITWPDLPSLCKDLVTLSVYTSSDIFQSCWIPDTIKYLELTSLARENYTRGSLIVPPGVEYLSVEDGYGYTGRALGFEVSILSCIDLSRVKALKTMFYHSEEAPNELIQTILGAKNTLEWLTILCDQISPFSTYEFQELASTGLGIKFLKLTIGSFGKELSDYQNFLTSFPELVFLEIGIYNYENHDLLVKCGADFKFILQGVIASFLRGSPRLSQIQLESEWELDWIVNLIHWITCIDNKCASMIYDVNVSEARLIFEH